MQKIKVVIINGLGGVGKSEFIKRCDEASLLYENAAKLLEPHKTKLVKVHELSTVDFVKELAKMCGWEGSKSTKDRIFLSDMKIALTKWNNVPITKVFDAIKEIPVKNEFSALGANLTHVVFINSREPEDNAKIFEMAKELGYDPVRLLISNPRVDTNEVPELIEGIVNMVKDYEIVNDGSIEDLRNKAYGFLIEILGGF